MATGARKPKNYAEYASRFPNEVQQSLQQIREAIRKAAPQAQETISYGMPAFRQKTILVWFAAHANHIGFYPVPRGVEEFKKELSAYEGAKSTLKMPYGDALPLVLLGRVVKFQMKRNLEKAKAKRK